ncbi:NAD(P)/FAD-dependent oxidoreductase [Chlamydiales bacterium]|nr:NAD(P)/FAD-dependent oxidoreductase [Chlamydiales bacterium]
MIYVVIGGGAAGFFGAIACANANPKAKVLLLEKTQKCLSKVRISGGGRCNVTHHCFEPNELVKFYPRGHKSLRGPFHRFQPKDTIEWFTSRNVPLKTESDGRMFPTTDNSETIIECLMDEAKRVGVQICLGVGVKAIEKNDEGFILETTKSDNITCERLLIASGSSRPIYKLIETLGHTIIPTVPSLFTFNIPTSPLLELSGISFDDVLIKIKGTNLTQRGPLLLTHWGFSGPAILKLSAWGARILHDMDYKATLQIDWIPEINHEKAFSLLEECKQNNLSCKIHSQNPFSIPRKLWQQFTPSMTWREFSNKNMRKLVEKLKNDPYSIDGKTTFKEEFVTCGGVDIDEVNLTTMESKICKNLYFAGEVLDIDGVTGGFNFQNAWTTSWIAGNSLSK